MQRSFLTLVAAAFMAAAPGLALAEDGGRGPAGGAFMSSYSTPPAPYRSQGLDGSPFGAPRSAFAVQNEPHEKLQPGQQGRRPRSTR